MPLKCAFKFDRPRPVYYSGEVINGQITLNTESIISVNAIYILFFGEAKVHFLGEDRNFIAYENKKTYLNSRTDVHGEGELPAGTHTYTCSIPLPLQCRTSCEEENGEISYKLFLIIDRKWQFNNKFSKLITVHQTFDLNQHPEYLMPIKQEEFKQSCCWTCNSGPVMITFAIPYGGYVSGQDINYTIEINNQSSGDDLNHIRIKLIQIYEFFADSPCRKSRKCIYTLYEIAHEELVLRLSKRMLTGALTIPPTPSSSQNEDIIMVRYAIVMCCGTDICKKNTIIDIPIKIGTIPLLQKALAVNQVDNLVPQSSNRDDPPLYEEATRTDDKSLLLVK